MEQNEMKEQPTEQPINANNEPPTASSSDDGTMISPQVGETCIPCEDAADANSEDVMISPPSYVYALGRIEPRFPSLGVEKEFAQAAARAETTEMTDRQALYEVLSQPQNRYLARQLCWVLTIQGMETYILQPVCSADLELLVQTLRPEPSPMDMDVVIGVRGPIASPEMCNGLMLPIVAIDQIYSFDRASLIKSIPRPKNISEEKFRPTAEELLDRIMQLTDNSGATDEHRAMNYLAVRDPAIYARVAQAFRENCSLTSVEVLPSPLSDTRKIVDVIFSFTDRRTNVLDKSRVRVDVTEKWPFLVTPLSPYYDR